MKEVEGGTLLRVIESGFDNIPLLRRSEAYRMNSDGWDEQMKNIENISPRPSLLSPASRALASHFHMAMGFSH